MKSLDVKAKFIELRAKGYSYDKIVKKLGGVGRRTLVEWNDEFNYEIDKRKNLILEELYEKALLNKVQRVRLYAKMLNKVVKELTKRSFEDIHTEKLIDKMFLLYDKLDKLYKPFIELDESKQENTFIELDERMKKILFEEDELS